MCAWKLVEVNSICERNGSLNAFTAEVAAKETRGRRSVGYLRFSRFCERFLVWPT